MEVSSIPPSTDVLGSPTVPTVPAPSEILCRPFLLHEAASLIATPDEWEVYMIVGRERGLLEALSPQLAEGTRFAMRRDLERTFWTRIVANLVAGRWRAVRVTPHEEVALGPYQATALTNPFDNEIAAALARKPLTERLVFQAIAGEVPPHVRQKRECEAIDYIGTWAANQGGGLTVDVIEAEIRRAFNYNFSDRAVTRIRKRAGLKLRPGPKAIEH